MTTRNVFGWGLGVLLGSALVAGVVMRWREPLVVTVAPAVEAPIETSFTADGVVKGIQINVASKIPATILRIHVQEGDRVQAGQTLITLADADADHGVRMAEASVASARRALEEANSRVAAVEAQVSSGIEAARAQLKTAEAELARVRAGPRKQEIELARHDLESAKAAHEEARRRAARMRALYQQGAVSQADLESVETQEAMAKQALDAASDAYELVLAGARPEELRIATSQVEQARAGLRQAEAGHRDVDAMRASAEVARSRVAEANAGFERAQSARAELTLTAPRAGVITRRWLEPGDRCQPGGTIVELLDPRTTYLEGEISDEDLSKARQGDAVTVTTAAFPGRTFEARIVLLGQAAELKPDVAVRTRILRVRIQLVEPNPDFKVGMEVDIEGKRSTAKPVLVIPSEALVFAGNEPSVWVAENGIVRAQRIKTGIITPYQVEVLEGVRLGEQVVIDQKERLTDGQRVRVRT